MPGNVERNEGLKEKSEIQTEQYVPKSRSDGMDL